MLKSASFIFLNVLDFNIMFAAVAMMLLGSASGYATLHTHDVAVQRKMFDNFKETHQKSYESKEHEETSFDHFVTSLKAIDQLNAQRVNEHDATFGLTSFADMNRVSNDILCRLAPFLVYVTVRLC